MSRGLGAKAGSEWPEVAAKQSPEPGAVSRAEVAAVAFSESTGKVSQEPNKGAVATSALQSKRELHVPMAAASGIKLSLQIKFLKK